MPRPKPKGRPSTATTATFISKAFGSQLQPAAAVQKPKGLDRDTPTSGNDTPIPSSSSVVEARPSTGDLDAELGLTLLDEPTSVEGVALRRCAVGESGWGEGRSSPRTPAAIDSLDSDNLQDTDLDSEDLTDSMGNGTDERETVLAFKSTAQGENEDGTVLNAENAVVGGTLNSTNRSSFEGKQKLSF